MGEIWKQWRLFAADIKLAHSVFAMPFALLATFMAAGGWPTWGVALLIVTCMFFARTFAMGVNRLVDVRLDVLNPRTAGRALPSGRAKRGVYGGLVAASAGAFVAAAGGFGWVYDNWWPVLLAGPVLGVLGAYPFLKRFTRLCHYYLGLALGLAPVCAWVAVAGTLGWEPLVMGLGVLLWTAGFDVIYACQDYQSDLATEVYSVPAKIGIAPALWVARATHVVAWGLLAGVGWLSEELGVIYFGAAIVAGGLLIWEHRLVKADNLSKLNMAFFTMNGIISTVLGVAGIIETIL